MANEIRKYQNFIGGLIEDNPLTSGATTLTSGGLGALNVVGATEHMAITLDPDGLYGAPEIVWITAHTAAAVTATIARGKDGTTAREHARDVPWVHALVAADVTELVDDAWTPWTPSLGGGWALGSGTMVAKYHRIGRTVHFRIGITFAADSTFAGGALSLTVPFSSVSSPYTPIACFAYDTSVAGRYGGIGDLAGSNLNLMYSNPAAGAQLYATTTTPFTWATGDSVEAAGTYEAAAAA